MVDVKAAVAHAVRMAAFSGREAAIAAQEGDRKMARLQAQLLVAYLDEADALERAQNGADPVSAIRLAGGA